MFSACRLRRCPSPDVSVCVMPTKNGRNEILFRCGMRTMPWRRGDRFMLSHVVTLKDLRVLECRLMNGRRDVHICVVVSVDRYATARSNVNSSRLSRNKDGGRASWMASTGISRVRARRFNPKAVQPVVRKVVLSWNPGK